MLTERESDRGALYWWDVRVDGRGRAHGLGDGTSHRQRGEDERQGSKDEGGGEAGHSSGWLRLVLSWCLGVNERGNCGEVDLWGTKHSRRDAGLCRGEGAGEGAIRYCPEKRSSPDSCVVSWDT